MKSLKLLVSLAVLVLSFQLFSQDLTFNKVISPLNTFSGFVGGITQDRNGYMWFATAGGLLRYDGYKFKSYSSTHLETVYADSKGMIWSALWVGGLERLDPATGNVRLYVHDGNDPGSISDDKVRAILEDHEGQIWIGTHGGLDKFDPATEKFSHFRHKDNEPNSLSCNKVRCIYEDREGMLWVGTGSPFTGESNETDEGGLNRFDRISGKFTRYESNASNPLSLVNNKVRAIFEDSKGNFWIGTAGDGLHSMDRKKGTFTRYGYDPAHPEKLSRPALNGPEDQISFITEDALHNLWIGTLGNGLTRYDQTTQKITRYNRDSSAGFSVNNSWSSYNSKDGLLWIGTFDGALYRIDPYHKNVTQHITPAPTLSFNADGVNNLWIGTTDGLIYQDKKNGTEKIFRSSAGDKSSLSNNVVNSLYRDSEGTLWIGTSDGLNRFNPGSNNFTRFISDPTDRSNSGFGSVFNIASAGNDSLWFATNNGLLLMNKKSGTFSHFRYDPKDTNSLHSDLVVSLLPERSGDLWVGMYGNGGFDYFDHTTRKFRHVAKGIMVLSMLRDSYGSMWLAGESGLYTSDDPLKEMRLFTNSAGSSEVRDILSLQEDQQKNIWVSTSHGVFRIDAKTKEVMQYATNYGIDATSLNTLAGYAGPDGNIYLGNTHGYYVLTPGQFLKNPFAPHIVVTDFSVNGKPFTASNVKDVGGSLEITDKISLRHNQNLFTFNFAALHFSSPENNSLLFMLDNYDQTWHDAATEKTASYFNVPAGHYFFHVKAASGDGVWAERSIEVVISPPWYETWWFRVLSVIAMVLVIYSIIKERSRKLKAENVRLEQKVTERTQQLQQSLNDLRSAQTQLIQSEKMASLGELTAGIAHEIQNPLNFVNNFSEVNKELIDELEGERSKGNGERNEQLENNIIQDIKANEEKIIYHGKRADAIVKSMLQHSRTTGGQKEPTDINALADEYLRLAYHGLRAKDKLFNAAMKTEFDSSIGKINIIPQEIGRALLNLINNAFYAVAERQKEKGAGYEPKVTVSTIKKDDKVFISIADNGKGIPRNILEKIFQPFFTTKPTGEGTGLGLSLAYDIVKAHGGEIRVETKDGQGSEFVLQLPI